MIVGVLSLVNPSPGVPPSLAGSRPVMTGAAGTVRSDVIEKVASGLPLPLLSMTESAAMVIVTNPSAVGVTSNV